MSRGSGTSCVELVECFVTGDLIYQTSVDGTCTCIPIMLASSYM